MSSLQLFLKYGGAAFWMPLMDQFYQRVMHCPCLQDLFLGIDRRHIKDMQMSFLEMVLTEERFDCEVIEQVHDRLFVSAMQFDVFLKIYEEVLEEWKVEEEDMIHIIDMMKGYRNWVIQPGDRTAAYKHS